MKPVEILREARKLIEKPDAWTQKAYARLGGNVVHEFTPGVESFCSVGALKRAAGRRGLDGYSDAKDFLRQVTDSFEGVAWWNDHPNRTHPEVLAAFDKAIALAEKAEAST